MDLFIKHLLILFLGKNTVPGLGIQDEKTGLNSQCPAMTSYIKEVGVFSRESLK